MRRVDRVVVGVATVLVACGWLATAGCGRTAAPKLDFRMDNALEIRREFELVGQGAGQQANPLLDEGRQPQWATLEGVFQVDDRRKVPDPSPLRITRDQQICAPNGETVYDELVQVGPNNGVKNLLIFLYTTLPKNDADEEVPVWVHKSYSYAARPELSEVVFDQKNCVFRSHVFAMRSDQRVKILNSDPVLHNTKTSPKNAVPINTSIPAKDFLYYEPKRQEDAPFSVSCSVHPWMSAWMITRDNPYFAVTDEEGRFRIANIPAGVELEFRIWQEKTKFLNETVQLNGQPLKLKKGKFRLTLNAGETRTLRFVVDGAVFR